MGELSPQATERAKDKLHPHLALPMGELSPQATERVLPFAKERHIGRSLHRFKVFVGNGLRAVPISSNHHP